MKSEELTELPLSFFLSCVCVSYTLAPFLRYTRLVHLPARKNDGAKMAVVEYVDREGEVWPAKPARGDAQVFPKSLFPRAAQAALSPPPKNL